MQCRQAGCRGGCPGNVLSQQHCAPRWAPPKPGRRPEERQCLTLLSKSEMRLSPFSMDLVMSSGDAPSGSAAFLPEAPKMRNIVLCPGPRLWTAPQVDCKGMPY